ncbi:MAG TPA: ABC transporter permease [Longimicrobiales bacterium]|nr:ABC transporter permease [Longimicrobiales bacterium]
MREILIVLGRELKERVRTRSFALGTLLFPVFMVAVLLLPTLTGGAKDRHLVVVNEAPPPISQLFVVALTQAFPTSPDTAAATPRRRGGSQYRIEVVPGPVAEVRADLVARIDAEELDGYIVLPSDIRDTAHVQFRSTRLGDPGMLADIRNAATEALMADRLARAGLNVESVTELLRPVRVDGGRVDERGEEAGTAQASFYFAYIVAMIIYIMIALYGSGVTRSVLEEKNNRIAEVLVSSMRATHLMAGKILGVGAAVMLQMLIWVVVIVLLVTQSAWLAEQFNINPAALNAITAQPGTALLLGAYFVLGFLLFAALFAGLGAAVTSDQEAQSFQMLFMLPLFVPLLFLLQLTTRPLEPLARTLGMIPFTAPVAMPMRMAAARIPLAEVLTSLALLAITTVLAAWLAGKIYRIGILSTGRRPSMRELIYWMRTG